MNGTNSAAKHYDMVVRSRSMAFSTDLPAGVSSQRGSGLVVG
jgi:hypothetical protein